LQGYFSRQAEKEFGAPSDPTQSPARSKASTPLCLTSHFIQASFPRSNFYKQQPLHLEMFFLASTFGALFTCLAYD
jgi:hypothetical protein